MLVLSSQLCVHKRGDALLWDSEILILNIAMLLFVLLFTLCTTSDIWVAALVPPTLPRAVTSLPNISFWPNWIHFWRHFFCNQWPEKFKLI